jgi:hypothetical protein
MSTEQFVAILTAIATVLGAVTRVIVELRVYHRAVNSKMDTLLTLTAKSSHAAGVLEGSTAPVNDGELPGNLS